MLAVCECPRGGSAGAQGRAEAGTRRCRSPAAGSPRRGRCGRLGDTPQPIRCLRAKAVAVIVMVSVAVVAVVTEDGRGRGRTCLEGL